ncbi:MAG: hypothetical protein JSV09_12630 [Thermoplasmata archaeon]|nr:MAG: hypothetical protein JSV09_12630 [Thermoplasmata archaeon]
MLRNNNLRTLLCVFCATAFFALFLPYFPAVADSSDGWSVAGPIEHEELGDVTQHKIVMNSGGDAMAVWSHHDGSVFNVWANRYIAGYGWEGAVLIEYNQTHDAYFPDIAINDNGDAIVVYRQDDGARFNIWANHYTKGQGWGDPQLIEFNDAGHANDPHVAMNNEGDAMAVWVSPGSPDNVSASNYTKGGGWSPEEIIESEDTYDASKTNVAMDENGNAVAIMRIYDGSRYNLYANNFTKGVGWDSADLIEDYDIDSVFFFDLAMDDNGNAIVVWEEWDSGLSIYNVSWNRFEIGTGWGKPSLLEDYDGTSTDSDIAVNSFGNAIAIWKQWEGGQNNLYARRYTMGSGWGLPMRIGYTESVSVSHVDVTLSDNGDAIAVWSQNDGFRNNIHSNRSTIESGWGTTTLVETNNVGGAMLPVMASDAEGNAIAIWQHLDGTYYSLWANRYVAPDITPPPVDITNPTSGSVVDIPTITVSGTSEYGVHLVVNGVVVEVEQDGSFEFQLALSEGVNIILATATDSSENSATDSITVTYVKPANILEEELQNTKDELNNTKENLTETKNALENTQAEIYEIKANLTETKNTLENTQAVLDETKENLTETKNALETTQAELEETKINLAETENTLETTQAELEETNDDLEKAKERIESQEMLILIIPIVLFAFLLVLQFTMIRNLFRKILKELPPSEPPAESMISESMEESSESMEDDILNPPNQQP